MGIISYAYFITPRQSEDGEPLGGARSRAEDDFADYSDLALPFPEPDAAATATTPAAKIGNDILSGINFTDSVA